MKDTGKTKEQLIKELANLRKRVSKLEAVESRFSETLEELQGREKRFEDIAANAQEWIWEVDKEGRYTYSSPVAEKILGYKPKEILKKRFYDLFHPDDREELKRSAFAQFDKKRPFREFINRNVHKNGETVWLSTSGVPVLDEEGNLAGYRGADTDITEQRAVLESLRESEEVCRLVTDSATDAVILINNKEKILMWNKAAESLFGYSADEALGNSLTIIMPDRFKSAHTKGMKRHLMQGKTTTIGRDFEMTALRKNGSEFPVEISLSGWKRKGENYFTGIIRDVTERKKMEKKLREASITDELTGLLNRRGFLTLAQKQMAIADRNKRNFSLLYLDLNDMKMINDEYGHQEGDQALIDAATILKKTFRDSDIIARVGGDEFNVLITEARKSVVEKAALENIQDNLRDHNEESEKDYTLSVSMGMVHYDPEQPCSLEELLARADELMYENKQRYQFDRAGLKHLKKLKRENRIGKRIEVDDTYRVELAVPEQARIGDISIAGICVETRQRLAKNAVYSIRMHSLNNKGAELLLSGIVVWSTFRGNSGEEDDKEAYYQSGLRFISLSDETKLSLKQFLADH